MLGLTFQLELNSTEIDVRLWVPDDNRRGPSEEQFTPLFTTELRDWAVLVNDQIGIFEDGQAFGKAELLAFVVGQGFDY